MAGALGNLLIMLTADTAQARSDIGKAAHEVERDMASMQRNATAAGMLIAEAIGKVAGSFAQAAKDAIQFGDQLNKMSQKSSLSVERLSEIAFAAELADVSLSQVGSGMSAFNKVLSDAHKQGSKASEMFKSLGVDITQGPQAAFEQFAKSINNLPDGETKAATLRTAFKGAGDSMGLVIAGLDEATQKAQQLGLVMSTQMAQDAERFNDNMTVLGTTMRALGLTAMQPLVGWLSEITDGMVKAKVNGNLLQVGLLEMGKTWAALWGGMAEKVGAGALAGAMQSEFNRLDAMVKKLTVTPATEGTGGGGGNAPGAANQEMLACVISGGKWVNGKCVPKAASGGSKTKRNDNLAGRQWQEWMEEEAKIMSEAAAATDKYNQTVRANEAATVQAEIAAQVARAESIIQMDEIIAQQTLLANGFDETGKAIADNAKKTNDWGREMGITFSSAFEKAILDGKKLSEVLQGLARDIAQTILRKQVTEPIGNAISKGMGSFLDGMFKADGGPVSGNTPYIVGERGPELFVPGSSGSIVPNHALGGMGGGVTVVQHINVDSRSDQATIMQAMAMAGERAKNDIMASLNRGGEFARATGRA